MKVSDKRNLGKVGADFAGLNWSVGLSQSDTISDDFAGDVDVNLVSYDDVGGIDTTLARFQLTPHTSVRLNGPAFYFDSGTNKPSVRLVGLSIAHEVVTNTTRNQLSGEVKITDSTLANAMASGPQAAIHGAQTLLSSPSNSALQQGLTFILPIAVAGLAVRGIDNAVHELKQHGSGSAMRGAGRIVGRTIRTVEQAFAATVWQAKTAAASAWSWFKRLVD